ncbi:MAG TPA: amino acid adenylation domain-containing protein [Longimicrobium sp.]|nr:amino acid adenylation domain-containing protein [Longimicrobium sp.]
MSIDNSQRDRLTEAKRLLLEKRLRGEVKASGPKIPEITRRGGNVHPMSYAQERLWFLDQLEPGSPFYNIPVASLVSAKIDIPTFEAALTEIVRRHESVRTVFRLVDGEPKQIILDPYPMKVSIEDMRGPNGEPATEDQVRKRVNEAGAAPFDLYNGPLFRAELFRISDADYAMLLTMHHIVTDGWSMPIVTRELDELYGAFDKGEPSPLPENEIHYPDYSAWQRDFLTGETLKKQIEFWRRHLEGAPTLELPSDRPRPAVLSHKGAIYRFVWPRQLQDKLREMGREAGSSVNMVIMAGYNLMLSRYSGQDDVVVGTLLGNRSRGETELMVGFFVNSAPVRTKLADTLTFRELVKQVRTNVLDADANQDLPFDKVVEQLHVERDPSRNPLFQVMYFHHTFVKNYHHKEESEVASALHMRSLFQETGVSLVDTGASKFDMTVATLESEMGMPSMVEYSTDLWDEPTIARMMAHTRVLLEYGCDHPDIPLSELKMVSEREERELLAWGTNVADSPRETTVVARFEAQAKAAPDAVAADFGDVRLTYGELNARANRVARHLRTLGVGPGARVGLATGHSAGMVAALAGVLKTGAAVVPLDPEYPADRLAFMVRDTGARVLLSEGGALAALASDDVAVVDLAREAAAIAAGDGDDLGLAIDPESEAYVIYTSGSTGKPKGVVIPHRAVTRTVLATDYVSFAPGDRVAQQANLSFDAAIWEVWGALANGATIVGIPRDVLLTPAEYARTVKERGVTTMFITTQLFNQHVREVPGVFGGLEHLLFGGEKADVSAVRRCFEGGKPARLVHVYGPTESTVFATWHEVTELAPDAHHVPIGRPTANTRAYVVDARGRLAGTGVPGELCLGGDGVALGYLDRPELTRERFVDDPFAGVPGARMYRTGDRVRWTEAGVLEFLGRFDDQVKIRGFRIELGEVEAALHEHPAVREAVAVAREDTPGERRLVAYIVGDDAEAVKRADFRVFLKERLPEYMVPTAFVPLDAIPLTPNGKVDRRKLPAPDASRFAADGDTFVAPRNRAEEVLAALWAEVLRVEKVGIHDNFFALGGDSILSIQIIARAAQEGVRVTPKQMFVHQTVAELASVAGTAAQVEAEQETVEGEVPLTPVQRWFLEQELPSMHHFNLSFLLFALRRLEPEVVKGAVAAVIAHHDALRLRYERTADGWRQFNAGLSDDVPFETVDLSQVAAGARDAALAEHGDRIQRSLDLEKGPLVRVALFDYGAGEAQRIVVIAHHLVIDAVSWGFLRQDLETACEQLSRGEEVRLPRKSTSFRQWAVKLADYARSAAVRAEAPFWTDEARRDVASLPVDFTGGSNTEGESDRFMTVLEEDETRALLIDVPPVYGTQINDVLLAGLARAFGRWTGRSALLVELEGHGREDLFETVDLSRTAGWFTAIYPVRLALPEDERDLGGALKGVKEQLRAVPLKGIGYGLLRHMSGDAEIAAKLAALPQAEVAFNYLGQLDAGAAAPASEDGLLVGSFGDAGEGRDASGARTHLLSVDALVAGGRLHVTWTYGTKVHARETVERLAEGFLSSLRELIAHCKDPEAGGYTPSDFELAGLDQSSLDALMAQLGG